MYIFKEIFIAMFPSAWTLIAGILTTIIFAIMKLITSPTMMPDIPQETLANFVPNNWGIAAGQIVQNKYDANPLEN